MSSLLRDPLTGEHVLMAAERSLRPHEFVDASPRIERRGACPFCPAQTEQTPEPRVGYPDDDHWLARVVPNRYPAVGPDSGRHLVVIESPRHVCCWSELTADERHAALLAGRDQLGRCREDGLPYAQLFKNSGAAAGASIEHCHSQLLACGRVPVRLQAELRGAAAVAEETGECFFCGGAGPGLLVTENDDFRAVCPRVSRFPYETWVLPRRHAARFEQAQQLRSLGRLLGRLVVALRRVLPGTAYNWLLHSAPFGMGGDEARSYHWHFELFPRLAKIAGYELATGHYINVVDPQTAAERLSAACPPPQSGAATANSDTIGLRAKNGTNYSD